MEMEIALWLLRSTGRDSLQLYYILTDLTDLLMVV